MRSRILAISVLVVSAIFTSLTEPCDAFRIHAAADTVSARAYRGKKIYVSAGVRTDRTGGDTAKLIKQGWDTVRVSLSGSTEFSLLPYSWDTTIVFLTGKEIELYYSPTTIQQSTAMLTLVGDSNTITIVLIGNPDTNFQCLSFGSAKLAPIAEGASENGVDTILNVTDSTAIIDSVKVVQGDTSSFVFNFPSFPQSILPHSGLPLSFTYRVPSPGIKYSYYVGLTVWVHGMSPDGFACNQGAGYSEGSLLIPWDTILLDLPPTASDTLTLDVHAAITGHALVIRNATAGRIFLQDMQITDASNAAAFQNYGGPHCRYPSYNRNDFCFDDTLVPFATSDTAFMTLSEPDSGTYNVNLSVNYANALTAQTYTIRAHYVRPQKSGVTISHPIASAEFSMRPNPARDEVTISLPTDGQSTIEIFDVLGNLLLRQNASGDFVWRGEALAGQSVPNGTYIVRVSQRAADGTVAAQSKRLMLMR